MALRIVKAASTEPVVCVVDDDASLRESLSGLLRSAGYAVATFASADELLGSSAVDDARCFIIDVCMQGLSGPELHEKLATSRWAQTPAIFMSGRTDGELRERLLAAGARAVFVKPFDDDAMLDAVTEAIEPRHR